MPKCCIFDCGELGDKHDDNDNWYCATHWKQYREASKMCSVEGCLEDASVTDSETGKVYCAEHIWKSSRPAEVTEGTEHLDEKHGVTHPVGAVREYVEPTKRKPEDVGTRFQHLADFQDYLSDGLLAVTNSLDRYKNDSDEVRKKNLESTLKLLSVYQERLADLDEKKWDLNNMLDKCAPARGVLESIREEAKKNRSKE